MLLYNKPSEDNKRINKYQSRTIKISMDEKPQRPEYVFQKNNDRKRYIDMVKNSIVRQSFEYRDYVTFLKKKRGYDHDAICKGISNANGKRYSIELHHEPFSLFDIINTVLTKQEAEGMPHNPYLLAEEVVRLHYDDKVGLIHLGKTHHELVESGKIFVPLSWIYQRYDKFYEEYEEYMDDTLKAKIELKVQMSMKCDSFVSTNLDPEFVYIEIDGVEFPSVPDSWGELLKGTDTELALQKD